MCLHVCVCVHKHVHICYNRVASVVFLKGWYLQKGSEGVSHKDIGGEEHSLQTEHPEKCSMVAQ